MNPALTLAMSLVGSLALSLPTLAGFLRGDIAADAACIRYVLAFAAARVGAGLIGRLVVDYANQQHIARLTAAQVREEASE